jgi:hypothetical protein
VEEWGNGANRFDRPGEALFGARGAGGQAHYGPQNSVEDAFWAGGDQAVLLVKSRDGSRTFMVNLRNVAAWRVDGTIASDEDLRRDWLRIEDT